MAKTTDILTEVVGDLVAAIENGAGGPWRMPWQRLGPDVLCPTNAATGRAYTGGNRWLLALVALSTGRARGTWATYRQWASVGAQVRRGEQAGAAVLRPIEWRKVEEDPDTGEETETTRRSFPAVAVFHADQVDGWTPPGIVAHTHDPIEAAETMVTAWTAAGMVINEGGDRACYRPSSDTIEVPDRSLFADIGHFYSTLAHEAGHWTAPRLGRDLTGRFGDDSYAAEELVAEMCAAVIGAHLGLGHATRDDHAAYLAGWLRILRADPQHLFTVAGAAETAAAHLLALAGHDTTPKD